MLRPLPRAKHRPATDARSDPRASRTGAANHGSRRVVFASVPNRRASAMRGKCAVLDGWYALVALIAVSAVANFPLTRVFALLAATWPIVGAAVLGPAVAAILD